MAINPYGDSNETLIFRGAYEARGGVILPLLPPDREDWPREGVPDRATFYHQIESGLIPYTWNEVNKEWEPVGGATWGAKEW